MGRAYLHAVVDTIGSYDFGFLCTTKQSEAPVVVVQNNVLPFYEDLGFEVAAVITDNGREFCSKDTHPYELYLSLNNIEHRTTRVRRPQPNGFVERFNRTVLDEFFRTAFRTKFYESVEAMRIDLDLWLKHYNTGTTSRLHEHRPPSYGYCTIVCEEIRNERSLVIHIYILSK